MMKKIILSTISIFLMAACTSQELVGESETLTEAQQSDPTTTSPPSVEPAEPVKPTPTQPRTTPKKQRTKVQEKAPVPKMQEAPAEEAQVAEFMPFESRTTNVVLEPVSAPAIEQVTTPAQTSTSYGSTSYGSMSVGEGNYQSYSKDKSISFDEFKPVKRNHFMPMRRRIDRGINQGHFAYKGELMVGLTASYGTMNSDNTDFMVIFDNINFNGTMATVKPFIGYFYRDNRAVGLRFGYQHMGGKLGNLDIDLGEQNDLAMSIGGMELVSDSYVFGLFHRSYVGLDSRGRFGLFAEVEASVTTGTSNFISSSGATPKQTYSDNFKAKIAFNPGLAVYIFPNVCTTVSIGLGGLQYSSVKQRDGDGNQIGSRKSSKMQFRVNIADINLGVVVHLWDKKK